MDVILVTVGNDYSTLYWLCRYICDYVISDYSTLDWLCRYICDYVISLSFHNGIALVFLSCSAAVIFLISHIMCLSLLFEYEICVESCLWKCSVLVQSSNPIGQLL
jgi:hypothetical protein